MHALTSPATFAGAALTFTLLAARRAARCGDRFDWKLTCVFCTTALTAIVLFGSALNASAVVAIAALTVSAATDIASGYVYDVVAFVAGAFVAIQALAGGTAVFTAEGALIGASVSFAIHGISRRRGLAFGDVKLFALAGASAGGSAALAVLGAAFVAGALVYVPLLALKYLERSRAVPFAPFIALAALGVGLGRP